MTAFERVAFFDVDETLIRVKSMFDFLRHWLAGQGDDGHRYEEAAAGLHGIARAGRPRTEVNRAYYRLFAGARWDDLMVSGREWYAQYRDGPDAFVTATVRALAAHRLAGDTVVLVSGSFRACLDPLTEELGADRVLCTEPVVAPDGSLTGEVRRPMIGAAKAEAVSETLAGMSVAPDHCYCYGDHASDLEMLARVGNPRVVGADPVLTEHAGRLGWPVLSAATGPLPLTRATN